MHIVLVVVVVVGPGRCVRGEYGEILYLDLRRFCGPSVGNFGGHLTEFLEAVGIPLWKMEMRGDNDDTIEWFLSANRSLV
jgi:hypothetical protein